VGGNLGAVAAQGHAAPAPRMGLGLVQEHQCAGRTLAGADQAEVRVADEVGNRLAERLEQLLGPSPSPHAPTAQKTRRLFLSVSLDLPIAVILGEQAVQRRQLGDRAGAELASALARPERVTAIISQNGNAYEEGLSSGWNPIQKYWREPSAANREALRAFLTLEATKWQYVHGVPDETRIAPESYTLDATLLARPGNTEIQLDLFLDYASNVALYPTFHRYFAAKRPPFLAVWGKNDPFFLPPGAEAFRRDIPNAEVHFYDTGHFALETHVEEIGAKIGEFLGRTVSVRTAAA
jgi:hypothetical protein